MHSHGPARVRAWMLRVGVLALVAAAVWVRRLAPIEGAAAFVLDVLVIGGGAALLVAVWRATGRTRHGGTIDPGAAA